MLASVLVVLHVIAGTVCLASGAVAAVVIPKGGRLHRLAGRVFVCALLAAAVTAGVLLCFRFQPFFFALSVLSFYFGYSGYRVLKRGSNPATVPDWLAAVSVVVVAGLSVVWGTRGYLGADAPAVLSMLGFAVVAAVYDAWRFTYPGVALPLRSLPTFEHLTKTGGAYIAVWCAFTANVAPAGVPGVWTQIAPAVVGMPILLLVANRYYRKWRVVGTGAGGAVE